MLQDGSSSVIQQDQINWPDPLTLPLTGHYLKVGEEAVQFLLAGPFVEVLAAGVEQNTHQSQAQQVLRGVQRVKHVLCRHQATQHSPGQQRPALSTQ